MEIVSSSGGSIGGYDWKAVNSGVISNWNSVIWVSELSLYVAVGSYGPNRVMTSPDGTTWTARNAASASSWQSVCWSPSLNLLVAVSNDASTPSLTNNAMYSSDGINWTSASNVPVGKWNSVCWAPSLNMFVAVGSYGSNRVMYSSNGTTWTGTAGSVNGSWQSVCWSPELSLFVAVANGTYNTTTNTDNRVMTSSNGTTWTVQTAGKDSRWRSVCWSGKLGMFVAVADGSPNKETLNSFSAQELVMISYNGLTWATKSLITYIPLSSVIWVNELGLFVACSTTDTKNNDQQLVISRRVVVSTNGYNWQIVPDTRMSVAIKSLCWSSDQFTLVGVSNTTFVYPGRTIDTVNNTCNVFVSQHRNVMQIGNNENRMISSVATNGTLNMSTMTDNKILQMDEINVTELSGMNISVKRNNRFFHNTNLVGRGWSAGTTSATLNNRQFYSMAWNGTVVVAVSYGSATTQSTMYSNDGNAWTACNAHTSHVGFYGVCWSPDLSLFVAAGANVSTSPNGITWTIASSTTSITAGNVCWSPELKMLVLVSSASPFIRYSSNATTWTNATITGTAPPLYDACWSAELGLFVAAGGDTTNTSWVVTSTDGINWTVRTIAAGAGNARGICWAPELGMFVTVGNVLSNSNSYACYSRNGTTWTAVSLGTRNYGRIAWSSEYGVLSTCTTSATSVADTFRWSVNGVDWNSTINSSTTITLYAMIYLPGLRRFVSTGLDNSSGAKSMVSSIVEFNNSGQTSSLAGSTWSLIFPFTDYTNYTMSSIRWANRLNRYIMVASATTYSSGTSGSLTRVFLSTNGSAWEKIILPASLESSWQEICYASDINTIVVVGSSGTNRIMISNDGNNWTAISQFTSGSWRSVCWSPELNMFVAVSDAGTASSIITSIDGGLTWTQRTSPNTNNLYTVCWSANLSMFVAAGNTTSAIYSKNGINWFTVTVPTTNMQELIWSSSSQRFVGIHSAGIVSYSNDGNTWNSTTLSGGLSGFTTICCADEIDTMVCGAPSTGHFISTDGINWVNRSSTGFKKLCWSPSQLSFISLTTTTNLLYSIDYGVIKITNPRASGLFAQYLANSRCVLESLGGFQFTTGMISATIDADGKITTPGAASISGGLTVSNGINCSSGTIQANAGITVTSGGATISGGLNVTSSGASINGGLTLTSGGLSAGSNGISCGPIAANGQFIVSNPLMNSFGPYQFNNVVLALGHSSPVSNTYSLYVYNAKVSFPAAAEIQSDYRLKTNIENLPYGLNEILQLRSCQYNLIQGFGTHFGFIAHEIQEHIPEVVNGERDALKEDGSPDYQSVQYTALVPVLVNAIQQQQSEIEELKQKNNALEERIRRIEEMLASSSA